jgi:hypothetical protein
VRRSKSTARGCVRPPCRRPLKQSPSIKYWAGLESAVNSGRTVQDQPRRD